jgi:MFS family permease
MLFLPKSIALTQVTLEFNPAYPKALIIASTLGSLVGSVFWGLSADVIGRKWAFNISLFICSISGIAAGAS